MIRRTLGIRVLIVGPDGSGKSTISRALVESMRQTLRVEHAHFDPLANASNPSSVARYPHEQRPRTIGQLPSLFLRWLRYWRSALNPGRPLSTRNTDIVLQERGWVDQVIDPVRYRLTTLGGRLAHLMWGTVPRTDGAISCAGDASEMVRRKPELSVSETSRQLTLASRLLGRSHKMHYLELDTVSRDARQTASQAERFVRSIRATSIESQLRPVIGVPRRLEMHATGSSRAGVSALYRPFSMKGRVGRDLHFRSPLQGSNETLRRRVAQVVADLDIPADGIAAIRSHGRDRIVLAIVQSGELAEFVKIGWGTDNGLEREADVLMRIQPTRELRIPQVTAFSFVDQFRVLRLQALPNRLTSSQPNLDVALDVAVQLRWMCDGNGVLHGDLAPWNLTESTPPGLIDWEHATLDFHPGHDLAFYIRAIENRSNLTRMAVEKIFNEYAFRCELDAEMDVETLMSWDSGTSSGLTS